MTLLLLRWWKPDQTLALLWVWTCRMIWMGVFPDLVHPPGREPDVVCLATPSSATQRMPAQGTMRNCFQSEEHETANLFGDFSDVDGDVSPPGASKRVKQEVASSSGLAGTVGPTPDPETPGPWRGPVIKGGWDVVEVPGGWIRFNLEKGRLDAHCGNPHHGGPHTCKMDRAAKKRPLGGELLWLALCTSPDNLRKQDHDKLKAKVFEPDRQADRQEKRIWLECKAAAERGKYQMLLDVEAAATSDVF